MRLEDLNTELARYVKDVPVLDFADIAATRIMVGTPVPTSRPDVVARDVVADVDGATVHVRIATPVDTHDVLLPIVLEMHGGGFALGSAASNDRTNQELAVSAPCIVVAVDYRLAPEHPYPAALEDCVTALVWLSRNAERLGGDPDRIGVLGTSAGACLAASTALWARDHGGPKLVMQALVEPALDDRSDSPSMRQGVDAVFWNSKNALLGWQLYLGDRAADGDTTPARRDDLSGLPPTYLAVNELDPLRDQGIEYARRLLAADVGVELHCWPGAFHGFTMFDTELGRLAQKTGLDAIRRLLEG